jgi:ParB family chromosome partitioning protein
MLNAEKKEQKEPEPVLRSSLPTEVELSLKEVLGNEVSVAYKDGRGSLTVHFYSDDQLRAFANLLGRYDKTGEEG